MTFYLCAASPASVGLCFVCFQLFVWNLYHASQSLSSSHTPEYPAAAHQLSVIVTTRIHSPALPQLAQGSGQFSCSMPMACSLALKPPGPVLLPYLGRVYSPHAHLLQLVRDRASSFFSCLACGSWQGLEVEGIFSSPMPLHSIRRRGQVPLF